MKYVISELIDNALQAQKTKYGAAVATAEPISLGYHFDANNTLELMWVGDDAIGMDASTAHAAFIPHASPAHRQQYATDTHTSAHNGQLQTTRTAAAKVFKTFARGDFSRYGVGVQACSRYLGDRLTVFTKKSGQRLVHAHADYAEIKGVKVKQDTEMHCCLLLSSIRSSSCFLVLLA